MTDLPSRALAKFLQDPERNGYAPDDARVAGLKVLKAYADGRLVDRETIDRDKLRKIIGLWLWRVWMWKVGDPTDEDWETAKPKLDLLLDDLDAALGVEQ